MKSVGLLVLALLLAGCSKGLRIIERTKITDTTTITKRVVVRDTLIKIPAAVVRLQSPLNGIARGFNQVAKKGQARLVQHLQRDTLFTTCICDSVAIRAQLRDSFEQVSRSLTSVTTLPVLVRVYPLWLKVLGSVGGVSLSFMVLWIVFKLKK